MCFSELASFSVGAGLIGVGAGTVRSARSVREMPLACIPLLFGIQQVAEGVVWHSLGDVGRTTSNLAVDVYLLFALYLWPVYIPIAAWLVEPSRSRRRIIFILGALGVLVSAYLVVTVVGHDVIATAQDKRIVYDLPAFPGDVNAIPYVIAVCLPLVVSSLRSLEALGLISIVTSVIAYGLYTRSFVSVWCFMAAIVSVGVAAHFLRAQGSGQRPEPCQQ